VFRLLRRILAIFRKQYPPVATSAIYFARFLVGSGRTGCIVGSGLGARLRDNADMVLRIRLPPYKSVHTRAVRVKTNPKIHAEEATASQKRYNDERKGIVRMEKYWNNHNGKTIAPSFLIEVMALDCLYGGYSGNFPHEFQSLIATLADRIGGRWPDPAGLGSQIDQDMTPAMRATARLALQKASQAAANASYLNRLGKTGEALDVWRVLFGPKFPLS
jgi:hypothetical protein